MDDLILWPFGWARGNSQIGVSIRAGHFIALHSTVFPDVCIYTVYIYGDIHVIGETEWKLHESTCFSFHNLNYLNS